MLSRRRFIAASAGAAGFAAPSLHLAGRALAQSIARPARMMIGFAPGGLLDNTARLLIEHVKGYAPSLIVDNRPGAAGRVSLEALKTADADGSVLGLVPTDQLTLYPHIYRRLSYRPRQDFAPVASVCSFQFLLAVGPQVPAQVRSLTDFVAWCRKNPAAASYGTGGVGTQPHFLGLALARAASFEFVHVPYKGAGPVVQDVIGGHLAAVVSSIGSLLPHLQAGTLRALGTMAPSRGAALPDVATFAEAGYPSLTGIGSGRMGVFLPARASADTIATLHKAIGGALATDAVKAGLGRLGLEPLETSSSVFAQLIASETERWAENVKASGFKPLN